MELFYSTELAVPLFQIVLLLTLSTFALLFGKIKLAMLINYLFALYWGYVFNRERLLGSSLEKINYFTLIYFAFGLVIIILALIAFLFHRD
ncbi:MAG: hypothetical protein AMJ45_00925 [Syntrophobacter sp. DG_60]|nr:MAG: hypothetical protein AMJ45_00925 [Syntrophobacter sp. DG_60]